MTARRDAFLGDETFRAILLVCQSGFNGSALELSNPQTPQYCHHRRRSGRNSPRAPGPPGAICTKGTTVQDLRDSCSLVHRADDIEHLRTKLQHERRNEDRAIIVGLVRERQTGRYLTGTRSHARTAGLSLSVVDSTAAEWLDFLACLLVDLLAVSHDRGRICRCSSWCAQRHIVMSQR